MQQLILKVLMRIKYFTKEQIAKIHIYPSRTGNKGIKRSKSKKNRVYFQNPHLPASGGGGIKDKKGHIFESNR